MKTGTSTWTLTGTTAQVTPWSLNQGTLSVSSDANLGANTGALTFNGGTLQFGAGFDLAATRAITLNAGGGTIDTNGFSTTIAQAIGGAGALTKAGLNTLILANDNTYAGGTTISAGRLQLGNFGTTGSIQGNVLNNGTLAFARSNLYQFDGAISGSGAVEQNGTGTTVLTNANTYNGPTSVNFGALQVDGSIVSDTTVNTNGTLAGIGTIFNNVTVLGGTFAPGSGTPGTSMTVSGNLAFLSGALYVVQLNPAATTSANVGGTATLTGGTVNVQFAAGSYVSRTYTILHAASLGGTTFGGLTTTNLPAGFDASLSYSNNQDVILNLVAQLGALAPAGSTAISRRSPTRSTRSSTTAAPCRRISSPSSGSPAATSRPR